jgi:hypothetical protein
MDEDGLGRKQLNARLRGDGSNDAQYAAGKDGAMSQGIADGREKQGEMRVGARIKFC